MLDNNYYELITIIDEETLFEVINYLENNFKWTKQYSNSLFKLIVKNNSNKIYGIKLRNKSNETIGAILAIKQTHKIGGREYKEVINLSSWFIDKPWRGICGMAMAIKITRIFKDSIITNYTPTKNVISILKALKFVEMKKIYFSTTLIDLLKTRNKNSLFEISKNESLFFDEFELNILDINKNSYLFRMNSCKQSFEFIGIKTYAIKKIFFFPIILPIFRILSISSKELVIDSWQNISKFILLSKKVAIVEVTIDLVNLKDKYLKYETKNKETYLIRDLSYGKNYFSPLNSELSISLSFKDQLSIITLYILRTLKLKKLIKLIH